jgi:hypothetical protein
MKLTVPTIGILATITILASVGVVYAGSFGTNILLNESSTPEGAAFLVANVKVTQFDEFGNVIALRQGTNHITATGMSVIMGQVFSGVNATYPDQANVTGRVGWMEIGTAGEQAVYANQLRWNNTDIVTPVKLTKPNCIRVAAGIDNSTQGAAHKAGSTCSPASTCFARMNVTAIAQFQGAVCDENSIDEAGIFTASSAEQDGMMFARNTFGSVNLGPLDTLQLEWEFTFTDS